MFPVMAVIGEEIMLSHQLVLMLEMFNEMLKDFAKDRDPAGIVGTVEAGQDVKKLFVIGIDHPIADLEVVAPNQAHAC